MTVIAGNRQTAYLAIHHQLERVRRGRARRDGLDVRRHDLADDHARLLAAEGAEQVSIGNHAEQLVAVIDHGEVSNPRQLHIEVDGFDPVDGRSLVPLFSAGAPDPQYSAYSDSFSPMTYRTQTLDPEILFSDSREDILVSILKGDYKYIHHVGKPGQSELFDLSSDPGERQNVRSQHPRIVAKMRADLAARPWKLDRSAAEIPMSQTEIENLEALGYIPDEGESR